MVQIVFCCKRLKFAYSGRDNVVQNQTLYFFTHYKFLSLRKSTHVPKSNELTYIKTNALQRLFKSYFREKYFTTQTSNQITCQHPLINTVTFCYISPSFLIKRLTDFMQFLPPRVIMRCQFYYLQLWIFKFVRGKNVINKIVSFNLCTVQRSLIQWS